MNQISFEVGRIVLSKQGRDKGKFFVVWQFVNDSFVLLVDGNLRKLSKPKLKRIKHLKAYPYLAENLLDKMQKNVNILDSDIRTELDKYREEC